MAHAPSSPFGSTAVRRVAQPDPNDRRPSWVGPWAVFALFSALCGDFWRNLVGWTGFTIIAVAVVASSALILWWKRPLPKLTHLPRPLMLFLIWCALSFIWSHYRPETLLALAAQWAGVIVALALAVRLTKVEFIDHLSQALRLIVGLSLVFELIAAIFFPQGILPVYLLPEGALEKWTTVPGQAPPTEPHPAVYWTQSLLFNNAAIQGIPGNRNLLGMVALLAVITVAVQIAAKRLTGWYGWGWLVISLVTLLLSRSATAVVTLVMAGVAVGLVWLARRLNLKRRIVMYATVVLAIIVGSTALAIWPDELFGLVNRSGDLSGRGDVWHAVVQVASDNWLLGLGWMSYWAPWIEPYRTLAIMDGVQYLQAHNAYLDVWMQTGVVGLFFFIGIVLSTSLRTWLLAIDQPQRDASGPRPTPHTAVLGFLLMAALGLQSLTESRLLLEGNWILLVYLAVYSKLRIQDLPALPRREVTTQTGPIRTDPLQRAGLTAR